jgi:hypothetical protein
MSSPDRNWNRIESAPRGIGPLLLRAGPGLTDGVYVGYQADDGRWFFGDEEVRPTHFCQIPGFDAEDEA